MLSEPILRLEKVSKCFGNFSAVDQISLDIYEGEFLTIVGPSGSGKSTLIRLLVGMDEITEGKIWLRDQRIDQIPANNRPTCMVFQSLALFPHMSVGQNIEFPLKIRGESKPKRQQRAFELLELLRLSKHFYDKRISQCSGGEQQRVALARALAFDPEILFFDEPLSALDYRLRKTLEKELKDLHTRTGKTFVYITHSLEEAMVMSDRIAIMKSGQFEQIAVADEIYSRPVSRFVAEFMGEVNLFDVEGLADGGLRGNNIEIHLEGASINQNFFGSARKSRTENRSVYGIHEDLPTKIEKRGLTQQSRKKTVNRCALEQTAESEVSLSQGEHSVLMVRPEFVRFLSAGETADFIARGILRAEYALGSRIQYEVEAAAGECLTIECLREHRYHGTIGDLVVLGWDMNNTHLIKEA